MKQLKDRLNDVIWKLRMTPNSFAIKANLSPSNMRKMLNGEQTITDRTLLKICDTYGIDFDWLKSGDGELNLSETANAVDTNGNKNENTLPFFDEEIFTGGYLQGEGAPIMSAQKVDDVKLPFLKVKDGDFAVQVHGRSMIDTEHPELSINDGAIVCLRPWTESFIAYGERYAIATKSGFTVKYIAESDKEGQVKCVPANKGENFSPYYINADDIIGIARVTAIINMQIL